MARVLTENGLSPRARGHRLFDLESYQFPSPGAAEEQAAEEVASEATTIGVENNAPIGTTSQAWTEERMAAAEPTEPPTVPSEEARDEAIDNVLQGISGEGELPEGVDTPTGTPDAGTFQNSQAERRLNQGTMPVRTIGQLYYVNDEGSDRRCTAGVINAENRNTVWTAGHCLHPGEGGTDNWFTDFTFVPDADDGGTPLGEWEWARVVSVNGWIEDGNWSYDLGAVELRPQAERGDLQGVTGAQGYRFGYGQDFEDVHFFGYPGVGYNRDDFNGRQLWYCENPTQRAGLIDDQLRMDCDMHSGASGGPWLEELETDRGWGYIISAYSHRTVEDPDATPHVPTDIEARAANHGDAAINVYEDVSG